MGKNKYLKRESYLKKLTIRQYYGEVKIITCSCRCGKVMTFLPQMQRLFVGAKSVSRQYHYV